MHNSTHFISTKKLDLDQIDHIIKGNLKLDLSDESVSAIQKCRKYLDKKTAEKDATFYGINTGFGSLCDIKISTEDTSSLQRNLVVSHSTGMGDLVPQEVVQLMLLLKIQNLAYGHSGIALETVNRLIFFYNNKIYPIIYQLGSLGASGDLAPLAHLSLPLLGEGKVWYNGEQKNSKDILKQFSLKPIQLQSKEGLALLNGTQFCSAYAVWALIQAQKINTTADFNTAIAMDAFDCRLSPFDEKIHRVRPHAGQIKTAENIRNLLKGSEIANNKKTAIQDPYSFRCVPQVHGASRDTIAYVTSVVEKEINSVTDNPLIFPDEDAILSGGNFHAQPLALVLDFLAIALSEFGSISEKRIFKLISGERGLPAFLVDKPGLNSGMMITQYTAASIASQNKQLCTPASVDTIVSSNGQEDHVSMGANAATKTYRVTENVERILAIEFMTAMQALHYRRPLKSSPVIEKLFEAYRMVVPHLSEDRVLHDDLMLTVDFLRGQEFDLA